MLESLSEIDFLEENLENCSVKNRYFVGYFDGKRDEFEDMLEIVFCITRETVLIFLGILVEESIELFAY